MDIIKAVQENNIELVEDLLQSGTKPNVKEDNEGWTALSMACFYGYTQIVKLLLQYGANPNIQKKHSGWTPLMFAIESGSMECVIDLLQAGANPNIQNDIGYTSLTNPAVCNNINFVRILLKTGANPYIKIKCKDNTINTLLHIFLNEHTSVAKILRRIVVVQILVNY